MGHHNFVDDRIRTSEELDLLDDFPLIHSYIVYDEEQYGCGYDRYSIYQYNYDGTIGIYAVQERLREFDYIRLRIEKTLNNMKMNNNIDYFSLQLQKNRQGYKILDRCKEFI